MPDLDEEVTPVEEQVEQILGGESEEQEVEEAPEVQEDEEEVQEEQEEEESEEEEPEKPVSRRESKRINQLLEKLTKADANPTPTAKPKSEPSIPEGNYSLEEINEMAEKRAEERYQEGLARSNAIAFNTRLDIDQPRVAVKYDYLNPESDNFNPGVTDLVNRMYLKTVGYNANDGTVKNNDIRYTEFVEGFVEAIEMISLSNSADSVKRVAKQAAQTGVRPGGTAKTKYQGDDPRKMTDEQLDAAISQMISK